MEKYRLMIPKEADGVKIERRTQEQDGIVWISLHLSSAEARRFPAVTLKVVVPACGVYYLWNPKIHLMKALNLDWFQGLKKANGFTGAPVQCLIGQDDRNRAALAISDTLSTFEFSAVPVEETGEYSFEIGMFAEEERARTEYDVVLRLDLRPEAYYRTLGETARWWAQMEENRPAFVPEAAKKPMYSTWYAYHQMVEEETLVGQCKRAKEYGCECLLLDDGWQTDDESRGYAYCGDWENALSKIPDMRRLVSRIHELGMKVISWYSVPFIGERSHNFERFRDMLIDPESPREWHVLDPRYPQVREFIIGTYLRALDEWDLDGMKLDFVDEFAVTPFSGRPDDGRRDFKSVTEAADHLMKSCVSRLRERKPDILLEFRQTYNGPRMRSYGNIFRAVDCPFDALENHVRVTDVRLLAGDSAVHSDMLMWNAEDSAESAALQIIGVLFSVPQISMRLEELSEEHRKMLRFYMCLWEEYRDALINGEFRPLNPSCRYNVVEGYRGDRFVCVCYSRETISMERLFTDMVFVNGSGRDGLAVENLDSKGTYRVKIYDCMGQLISDERLEFEKGVRLIGIPCSGTAILRRVLE